jgi:hypothetical protein
MARNWLCVSENNAPTAAASPSRARARSTLNVSPECLLIRASRFLCCWLTDPADATDRAAVERAMAGFRIRPSSLRGPITSKLLPRIGRPGFEPWP